MMARQNVIRYDDVLPIHSIQRKELHTADNADFSHFRSIANKISITQNAI